jgi:hypothetical protein
MTKTETERLTRMEDNQEAFAKAIEKVLERLDEQDKALAKVNKTLDELTGGKRALMWMTGTLIGLFALGLAFFKEFNSK